MKLKKILSFIMSAALFLIMPGAAPTAAEEDITYDSTEKSGKINIDYSMEVSYTVTIPASVTFSDNEKQAERSIQARDVMLNEGSALNVNVSSLNNFKMKNGKGYIDYYLMVNYNKLPEENDHNILTVNAGENSGWAVLSFITELDKANAVYAGTYTDTLTFTVSVV